MGLVVIPVMSGSESCQITSLDHTKELEDFRRWHNLQMPSILRVVEVNKHVDAASMAATRHASSPMLSLSIYGHIEEPLRPLNNRPNHFN